MHQAEFGANCRTVGYGGGVRRRAIFGRSFHAPTLVRGQHPSDDNHCDGADDAPSNSGTISPFQLPKTLLSPRMLLAIPRFCQP